MTIELCIRGGIIARGLEYSGRADITQVSVQTRPSNRRSREFASWKPPIKLSEKTGLTPKLPVANDVNGFLRASDSYV